MSLVQAVTRRLTTCDLNVGGQTFHFSTRWGPTHLTVIFNPRINNCEQLRRCWWVH